MPFRALHRLPAEVAHQLAIWGLGHGLVGRQAADSWPRLATRLCGLELPNALGLAAGFDKNAQALPGLAKLGFGWIEIGTVLPRPQAGNPRPRVFRLPEHSAVINRLGFNSQGLEPVRARLVQRRPSWGVIGANLGANRDTKDPALDYVTGLRGVYPLVDYVTINVSSPNTPGLRELQHGGRLEALLQAVMEARETLAHSSSSPSQPAPSPVHPQGTIAMGGREGKRAGLGLDKTSLKPILLKIAPDLEPGQEGAIAETAMAAGIDGLVVSNTTLARPDLRGRHRDQSGGLSGPPLMARSTAQIARLYRFTGGKLPLVGVGGIACGADAYAKIRAGASALQLYTAFIYQGPAVVGRVLRELDTLLARDGHASVNDAVGGDL